MGACCVVGRGSGPGPSLRRRPLGPARPVRHPRPARPPPVAVPPGPFSPQGDRHEPQCGMRRGLARKKRRRGLDRHRRLYVGITGLVLVIVIGTVGFLGFGMGFLDALFQTVITVSTVGFGEAKPFDTGEKVFTIFLILVGVAMAAYTFSVAIDTFVEGYLGGTYRRRRMEREINAMHGHVILCGWGRVGQAIARHLLSSDAEIVVVDASTDRLASLSMPFVHGDATDEAVLRAAGIDRARVLVTALNTDADNLYVTLTARSMASRLFIVSRAATEAGCRQAGLCGRRSGGQPAGSGRGPHGRLRGPAARGGVSRRGDARWQPRVPPRGGGSPGGLAVGR